MPAVIPLAALVAALVALLVLYATGTLAHAIASVIPNWHIIGLGHLRDAVLAGIDAGLAWCEDLMDDTIAPLAKFITAVIARPERLASSLVDLAGRMRGVAAWIVETYIPREVAALRKTVTAALVKAEAYAVAKVAALAHTVAADLVKAETYARTEVAGLAKTVEHDLSVAETYAKTAVAGLAKTVAHDLAVAETYADTRVTALAKTVTADVNKLGAQVVAGVATAAAAATAAEQAAASAAVTTATSTISAVTGYVDLEVSKAVSAVWPEITDAVDGAIDAAGNADADITDALGDLAKAVPTDLVGTIAGVTTISLAMTRFLRDCGIPNCRNLSELGKFLENLLGLAGEGALLAMLLAMIHDPEQAAVDVQDDLGGLLSGAVDTVKGLLNVA